MDAMTALREDLITACHILSQQRLVEGFGHVSARLPGTDSFLITPRIALAAIEHSDLLTLDLGGNVIDGRHQPPFETWLHTAIMKSHREINAITRVHARTANMFSVTDRKLEPVHNHGSFFSGGVPVFFKPDLIATEGLGDEVARALGNRPAILLRGNGQVTVGRTIPEAVMMAIYLEEAAQILHGALQIGTPIPLTPQESSERRVEALPPVDLERAWNFFKRRAETQAG
jgi:ribulose-5-phosphate 4-epimerase/fuculose-1-phosphate aldolase